MTTTISKHHALTYIAMPKWRRNDISPSMRIEYADAAIDVLQEEIKKLRSERKKAKIRNRPASRPLSPAHIARLANVDAVVSMACEIFKVSRDAVMSRSKVMPVVEARQVAMAVMVDLMNDVLEHESLSSIARMFGRDHATVMHAARKVEKISHMKAARDRILSEVRGHIKES